MTDSMPLKYRDFIQSGTIVSIATAAASASTISFPTQFSTSPKINLASVGSTIVWGVQATSTAEATVFASVSGTFEWVAIRSDV